MEGKFAEIPKAGEVARRDVPTCQPGDRLRDAFERSQAAGWKSCIVVNEADVVLGRLRGKTWEADPETIVEEVMEDGPTTFRPDNFLAPLIKRMQDKQVGTVLITNSDGVLIGVLYRKDGEQRLHQEHAMHEDTEQAR